jgi:PAS domain S-box-containing protein
MRKQFANSSFWLILDPLFASRNLKPRLQLKYLVDFFSIHNPKVISCSYLIVGVAWVFFSDQVSQYIFSDNISGMATFQLYKGIFYVVVTSLMLYFLIKKLVDYLNWQKQKLKILFSNPDLGILKLDADGALTQISDNIITLTGYSAEELIGKSISHYTPESRIALDREQFLAIAASESKDGFEFSKQLLTKENVEITIKGYAERIKTGRNNPPEYIVAFQNITKEIQFLDELLEAHDRYLREIASQQSHLVRAPLARIMGISKLLQNPGETIDEEMLVLIRNLEVSAEELDLALRNISQKMNTTNSYRD